MRQKKFRLLSNRDFTLAKYEQLCEAVANSRYVNVTFEEYFDHPETKSEHFVILRHDIDENCKQALDVARTERQFDLKATYYFRMKKGTYVLATIDEIAACNHEIGYHYETIDRCHGDIEAAVGLFRSELAVLRRRYGVRTACMHGNPLTKYDNKEIWLNHKLSDFGLIGEPYLSLDYAKFAYFSDSGRTWGHNTWRKMKDKVRAQHHMAPRNTDDLIEIVKGGELGSICILTHPERWSKNIVDYSRRYLIDMAYSVGKTVIHRFRNQ